MALPVALAACLAASSSDSRRCPELGLLARGRNTELLEMLRAYLIAYRHPF